MEKRKGIPFDVSVMLDRSIGHEDSRLEVVTDEDVAFYQAIDPALKVERFNDYVVGLRLEGAPKWRYVVVRSVSKIWPEKGSEAHSIAPFAYLPFTDYRVKLVVIEGHTLGFVLPGGGVYSVLKASLLKGARPHGAGCGPRPLPPDDDINPKNWRLATRADFDEFGVSAVGFFTDQYEFAE